MGSNTGRARGWVAHVPMDGFHLADAPLRRLGQLDPQRALRTPSTPLGYAHLLEQVLHRDRAEVYAPGFDRIIRSNRWPPHWWWNPRPGWWSPGQLSSARAAGVEREARQTMDRVWFVTADQTDGPADFDGHVTSRVRQSPQAARTGSMASTNATQLVSQTRRRGRPGDPQWRTRLVDIGVTTMAGASRQAERR